MKKDYVFSKYQSYHIFQEVIRFETDLFFKAGLPPEASKFDLKKQLKSLAKRIFLQEFKENMSNIRSSSQRVLTCPASVFGLYRFINKNISSSISASRNIILMLLSVLILLY